MNGLKSNKFKKLIEWEESIIKILILGANGQLGSAISNKLVHTKADVTSLTKQE